MWTETFGSFYLDLYANRPSEFLSFFIATVVFFNYTKGTNVIRFLVRRSAALCLAQALLKCPVPKSLISASGWDFAGAAEGGTSPNLKESFIAWMLMSDQSDELEDSSRPHPIICRLAGYILMLIFVEGAFIFKR